MNNVEKRRAKRRKHSSAASHFPVEPIKAAIVFLVIAAAFGAAIAYGAVDAWATAALAVLISAILLLWIADAWKTGTFSINIDALYVPLLGLILIGIIQLLPLRTEHLAGDVLNFPAASAISLDPYATRIFTVRLIILTTFFAAAYTFIDTKAKLERSVLAIVIFGSLMAFFGILQRLSGIGAIYGLRASPQAIPFGPFVNQHHFAGFMEMTSGLALGVLIGRGVSREGRIFLGLAAVVMGIGIIFTGSRGGLLSYCGVLAVAGVLSFLRLRDGDRRVTRISRMAAFGGGAALLIAVIATAFFLGGGEALFRGLGPNAQEVTSGRTHFWAAAWHIFLDHPAIGAGFDAFGVAFTRYDTWNGTFRIEQAHNDYLQTLADAGIAGIICVFGFIYLLTRKSLTMIANSRDEMRTNIAIGALAGCTGIIIHSIFDFPLRTTSNALFFLLLVVFASAAIGKEGNAKRSLQKVAD